MSDDVQVRQQGLAAMGCTGLYPESIDCSWLALDCRGNIALFSTGGSGPIPVVTLANDGMPFDAISRIINVLPKSTKADSTLKQDDLGNFLDYAERGLFVYDWTDVHRVRSRHINAYERVATPDVPLTEGLLSSGDVVAARIVRMHDLSFSDQARIDLHQFEVRRGEDA